MANPKITLTGRVGTDPESVGSGLRFRVATNDRAKNEVTGEWEDKDTSWWTIKAWKKQADYAKNVIKKGQEVTIVGTIYEDSWVDKTTGTKRTAYEINADSISVSTYSLQGTTNNARVNSNVDAWLDEKIEVPF